MAATVTALQADLMKAEREWARLDAQADRSASIRSAALVDRLHGLRLALAQAEQKSERSTT
jgi:hypothetical protein